MGKKKRAVAVDRVALTDLYIRKNMTMREVASELSVSLDAVFDALHLYGISKPSGAVHHDRKTISKEDVVELYINQNLSLNATAEMLGVGHSTLINRLKEWGIRKSRSKASERRKETNVSKYGGTSPLCSPAVREKLSDTCMARYGETSYSRTAECKDKTRRTCLERYGQDCVLLVPEVKDRIRETNIKNYGYPCPLESKDVKRRIKDAFLDKYGVDNPMKDDAVKLRAKDAWSNKSAEEISAIREKRESTCLRIYGYKSAQMAPSIRDKRKGTMKSRYGKEYASQVPEFKDKAVRTNKERYGVPYACQRKEARIGHHAESKPNGRMIDLLTAAGVAFDREFPIGRFSYDFKIGDNLIEVNPTATHNIDWSPFGDHAPTISKEYHLNKTAAAESSGYRCIHIFDWDNAAAVVNLLKHRTSVYARKCEVREVSKKEATEFIDKYHVQYDARASFRLGLYHQGNLISVMTFGKPRYNKKYEWELVRYCSMANVIGGAEKLFAHFVGIKSPKSVVSYCDRGKFSGETYRRLGFESVRVSRPCVHWCQLNSGAHLTDNYVRAMGFDRIFKTSYGKGTSNAELLLSNGFVRVCDCGQETFVWESSEGQIRHG